MGLIFAYWDLDRTIDLVPGTIDLDLNQLPGGMQEPVRDVCLPHTDIVPIVKVILIH